MKQIYSFESINPPQINELKLKEALEVRRLGTQISLLAAAGMITQILLLCTAVYIRLSLPIFSFLIIAYVAFSMIGFTIILIYLTAKRRELKCSLPL